MKLKLEFEDKNEVEIFILILIIGVLTGLKNNAVTLEEAEQFLFSPYSAKCAEKLGIDKRIEQLIYLGCELENVLSIIPDKFNASIDDILNRAIEITKSLESTKQPADKWIKVK